MFKTGSNFFKRNRNTVTLASIGILGLTAWKANKTLDEIATVVAIAGCCDAKYQTPFFHVGVMNNPKYDKRFKGGEDALAVSNDQRLIMVADGVGGWTKKDVDPGKFSKFLCK